MKKEQVLSKAEQWADLILRKGKHFLPHIARLCLVSTFIEDGLRMWLQWESQGEFMSRAWRLPRIMGTFFVLFNMVSQLGGVAFLLAKKYLYISIGVLAFIVGLQVIAYKVWTDYQFLMRSLALLGGLFLLAAESNTSEGRSLFAGLPSAGDGSGRTYLQLGGRLLLVFMLLTLTRLSWSLDSIFLTMIGLVFAFLIGLGYKTKLSSLLAVAFLTGLNIYMNNWWSTSASNYAGDYKRYNFFQILSVVGGLLLVVAHGPGGYSIDERKKQW